MTKVTTSWDDGDTLDKHLADLLSRYGVKGTFYITKDYRPERLSENDIRNMAKSHEIGAHTLSHPDLRELSGDKLEEEVSGSKDWLEGVLGYQVKMFCYPKGQLNEDTVEAAKRAGFIGARTTELASISAPTDTFQITTTLQVYPFPFRKIDNKKYYWSKLFQPYTQRSPGLKALGVSTFSMYSWLSTAKTTFDIAMKKGGVFHLWGHSWEIEKYGMWGDLEKLLQYITKHKDCDYVTNGDLIR